MTDTLALGPDGQTNHTLALMRTGQQEGDLSDQLSFLPGVSLHADPALGLAGRYQSKPDEILTLEAQMQPQGHWIGLHIDLPARNLQGAAVIGLASRGHAPDYTILRPCLRSGTEDGFVDCFFDKHMLLHAEDASHLDALPIRHRNDLPLEAPWRELVLFLPTEDFQLTLTDLRVFVV